MPKPPITVTVTVKCKKNGGLSISVDNWEVHGSCKQNAEVEIEWVLKALGPNDGRVQWMRIENPGSAFDWPFQSPPPATRLVADPTTGFKATSGPYKAGWQPSTVPVRYGLTICFSDDTTTNPPVQRYAYIDPDMVIEGT